MHDLRYAIRTLAQNKAFTIVAVLTLALGIGADTAIFSIVNAVLLTPLSYKKPDQLVYLREMFTHPGGEGLGSISVPNFFDWQEQNHVFEEIGAYRFRSYNLTGAGTPTRLPGVGVAPEVFRILGVEPLAGRYFRAGENEPGNNRVVVLSYGLWQSHFGGSDIVGNTIQINGEAHTVIGIMPRHFQFPPRAQAELWAPLTFTEQQKSSRGNHWMALGAERSSVLALIMSQGVVLTIIGLVLGLLGSLALTRFMSSFLFGVAPTDARDFLCRLDFSRRSGSPRLLSPRPPGHQSRSPGGAQV